jgi:hypothetical protein
MAVDRICYLGDLAPGPKTRDPRRAARQKAELAGACSLAPGAASGGAHSFGSVRDPMSDDAPAAAAPTRRPRVRGTATRHGVAATNATRTPVTTVAGLTLRFRTAPLLLDPL